MTEAGRSPEPPLMAPPGRDAEQDGLIEDTAPPSGLMSTSRSTLSRPGTEEPKANGEKKPVPAPGSSVRPSASSTQVDVPFPADEIRTPNQDVDRERGSATGAALSGKLDSGRQAVRQAVAATNNWIVGRSAKSDPSAPAKDNTDKPGASGTEASGAGASGAGASGAGASGAGASVGVMEPEAKSVAEPSSGPATVVSSAAGAATVPAETASANSPRKRAGTGTGWPAAQPSVAAQPSAAAQQASYPPSRSSTAWSPTPARPPVPAAVPVPNRGASAKWRREAARRSRRQAHLTLARVEPWSVMKFSGMVSIVAFIVLFVAIAVVYMALSGLGVFTSLQHTVSTITSSQGSSGTNISTWFSASRILGWTAGLGAIDIVLITAISTIGAVIYNLIAQTIGGIEITLRETE